MGPERFNAKTGKPFEGTVTWDMAQRTDIWSLGICLFELTHGRLPWDPKMGTNMAAIGKQVYTRHPSQFIMSDACALSPEAKNFVASLLSPIPDERPTCQEALRHPWLVEAISLMEEDSSGEGGHEPTLPEESVRALLLYLRSSELKRALAFCLSAGSTNLDFVVSPVVELSRLLEVGRRRRRNLNGFFPPSGWLLPTGPSEARAPLHSVRQRP